MSSSGSSGSGSGSDDSYKQNDKSFDAIKRWLSDSDRVTIGRRERMAGGFSGALTEIVRVLEPSQLVPPGYYVCKLQDREDGEQEYNNHQEVFYSSESVIKDHMPQAYGAFSPAEGEEGSDQTAIFYTIAGDGFANWHSMQQAIYTDAARTTVPDFVGSIVDFLLNKWTLPSSQRENGFTLNKNFIEVIRRGLDMYPSEGAQMGRVLKLYSDLNDLVRDPSAELVQTGLSLPGHGIETLVNPLPFIHGEIRLPSSQQFSGILPEFSGVLLGQIHRDVHPGNLVIRKNTPPESPDWYIIDFARYGKSSDMLNALYDAAYLEIVLLIRAYHDFESENFLNDWWEYERTLLTHLQYSDSEDPKLQSVMRIRKVLARIPKEHEGITQDSLEYSYLAASIEAGLNLARKLSQRQRRMAYLTAVSRFDTMLKKLGIQELTQRRYQREGRTTKIITEDSIPLESNITGLEQLFDPEIPNLPSYRRGETVCERLKELLAGEPRIVCLTGGYLSGKTSFLRAIRSYEEANESRGTITIDFASRENVAAKDCMDEVRKAAKRLAGRTDSIYELEPTIRAMIDDVKESLSNAQKHNHIWFIDDIDRVFARLNNEETGRLIQFITGLVQRGVMRVFVTATRYSRVQGVIESLQHADEENMAAAGRWWARHCVQVQIPHENGQVQRLLRILKKPASLDFNDAADEGLLHAYSGGYVYAVKYMVRALMQQPDPMAHQITVQKGLLDDTLTALMSEDSSALHFEVMKKFDGIYTAMPTVERVILTRLAAQQAGGSVMIESLIEREYRETKEKLKEFMDGLDDLVEIGILRSEEQNHKYGWAVELWKRYIQAKVAASQKRSSKPFTIDMAKGHLLVGESELPLSFTQLKLLQELYYKTVKAEAEGVLASALGKDVFELKLDQPEAISHVVLAIEWLEWRVQNLLQAIATDASSRQSIRLTLQSKTDNSDIKYSLYRDTDYIQDPLNRIPMAQ